MGKTPKSYEDRVAEIAANASPSVAMILIADKKGNYAGSGTGFFVSKEGNFVTNKHVVANAFSAQIVSDEELIEVKGYYPDQSDVDLVVLKADGEKKRFKPLAIADSRQVKFFQRVVVIGYPQGLELGLGMEPDVAAGNVNQIRKLQVGKGEVRLFQFDCRVDQGSSGSPVLNLDGGVIGVASASTIVHGINLALPSEYIPIPKDERIVPLPFGNAIESSVIVDRAKTIIKELKPNAKDVLSALLFIIFGLFTSIREGLLNILVNLWHSIYLLFTTILRLFS